MLASFFLLLILLTDLTMADQDASDSVTPDPFSDYDVMKDHTGSILFRGQMTPLVHLIKKKKGYSTIAKYIKEHPSQVLLKGPISPLRAACMTKTEDDVLITELLLQSVRPSVHEISKCLTSAIVNNKEDMVRVLLTHPSAQESVRIQGSVHLNTAASVGRDRIFEILIEHGATIDHGTTVMPNPPYSILMTVLNRQQTNMIKVLRNHGVDMNMPLDVKERGYSSQLLLASECYRVWETVQQAKALDKDQIQPAISSLMGAINTGICPLITAMLDNGADPNWPYPSAALEFALFAGKHGAFDLLLERGSKFENLHPASKRRAIERRFVATKNPAISEDLSQYHTHCFLVQAITQGTDREVKTILQSTYYTANLDALFLVLAIERKDQSIIRALINHPTLSINTDYGMTPLVQAILVDDMSLARHLIEMGANINQPSLILRENAYGYGKTPTYVTPLTAAVMRLRESMVRLLLSKGALLDGGDIGPFEALCELVNIPESMFRIFSDLLFDPSTAAVSQPCD